MTTLAERQKEFCSYFIAAGYPMRSAAAIGGNATRENLVQATTEGAKDHGSDGVLQWRKDRLYRLQSLPNWATLKTQAQFTILELQAKEGSQFFDMDYHVLEADLRAGTKSLETLTLNFCDAYERPSDDGRVADIRIAKAHDCQTILMRDATGPFPVPVPPPAPPTAPIGVPQMPIDIGLIIQLVAPLAESLVSGLLKGVLTHAAAGGIIIPPVQPLPISHAPPGPAPSGLTQADFAMIAQLIAAEFAKLQHPPGP